MALGTGAILMTKGELMMDIAPRWIVAADTPGKMIPQEAKVLCVVDILRKASTKDLMRCSEKSAYMHTLHGVTRDAFVLN